jgi:hypothetical protein
MRSRLKRIAVGLAAAAAVVAGPVGCKDEGKPNPELGPPPAPSDGPSARGAGKGTPGAGDINKKVAAPGTTTPEKK